MKTNILIIGLCMVLALMCGTATAWWDTNWSERREVAINNTGASAQTGYEVYVNLTDDPVNATSLRVVNETALTIVPHYNAVVSSGNVTSLWFKSTVLGGSSWINETYYIYSENAAASSTSSGVNTFIGFEDFEGGNVDRWTLEEAGSFTAATTLVKSGTYSGKYDTATQQVEAYFGKGLGAAIDDYGLPFQSTGIGYDSVEDVLWHGNFNNMTVMKHQKDGTFISELSVDIQGIQGVTHDSSDDSLWAASYWNNTVYNFHKNGTMIGVNITGVTDPTGISYEAATDTVWVQSFPTTLYHYHASNGTELENFSIPTVQYLDGCAYDDQDDTIWQLDDGTTHSVRHYFAGNMTFIESFAIANDAEDLTIDTTDHTMYRDVDPSATGHTYHVNIDVMTAYSKIVYEWDAASHLTNTYAYFLIEKTPNDITNSMCIMFFNDAQIEYYDGSHNKLRSYSGDTWYHFKAIMDCPNDTYDLYIDDVLEADNGGTWGSIVGGVKTISIQSLTPSSPSYIDNLFVRKYAAVEPTSSLGAEEDAPSGNIYIPPDPTTLANTTGNFWVNHTWAAGSGNVTDSYNVSQNGTWTNTSANLYFNATDVGAHGYSDVTVWAWNSSGSGTLSAGSITQNTTVPNNAITISDVSSSYSILEGETLSIDANYTDADGDTGTFADNSTEWNVNSGTGIVSWVTVDGDQGTYGWLINVSDGYGSTSAQEFVVTVIDSTPTAVSNMANTTGNFWINWTWTAGANVDDYDVWIDEVDVGADITNLYYNHSASAHTTVNISVRSHNHTLPAYSAWVNDTMTVPNNAITITNTSDQNVNEGQNIYVDYDATDADSDAPAFSCNRTDLFADFSTSTGKGNWTTGYTDAGTYYVDFGVSDGYGSTSNYTMTITVADFGTPGTPTGLANTTGNFWVNHTWTSGANTDTFNVSVNTVWYNNTAVAYNNTTASTHAWVNITLAGYNITSEGISAFASQDTQIPNNPITITNTSDWSGDEGENVYVDYDATDADSDTPTFSCNRTDLFTDFDTANGTGNWTAATGTYYVDFGVSDGYGSTSNYTMTITTSASPISITLHSVSPDTIQTNYTGVIQVNYIVESPNPLNLSTLAMLYGINYTPTGDMHSYTAVPSNSLAAEGIYRAPYRNTTPYLSWENNATITEGNVWQWGGGDNDSAWINVTSINATHTWINATGHPEHIFQGSFYLGRRAINIAPKTGFEVNTQQGLIIKMWDNEAIRGRSIDYLMNMYFDSDWESTIPTSPIEIWGLNSSFNPDTDDPTTSEWGAKIVEWDGNRWVNHSWIPDANASYSYPLVFNASTFPVIPDEVNYIYLKSDTQSSKSYVLNATNYDPGICNITYAQTETMWTYDELADVSTQSANTPSFFTTFVRDDEQFLHHLYIADDQGEWAHSDINNISIGVSHYPAEPSSFEYFNISCPAEYDHDTYMDATYDSGYIYVGIYCHADPDGGTVSHNLTIHYANGTIAGIVNDTFTTTTPGIVEINFSTTPYYSTSDAYTLKCVSTDDEGSVATTLLGSVFTLAADGTQGYYVDTYLMFWGMNDVPTLYTAVNNNSLISYDAGDDIYTMHVPFFKSKCNDTFRFNETVHLKSLNTADVAYFKFHGITIFDNATISAWNTASDTLAPSTDAYRGYLIAIGGTWGNITNSDLSYLGSDIYRQEGLNFVDNTHTYLIYNTIFSHNGRGMIMEECENYNISHCNIIAPVEAGVGVYYCDNIVVENCTVTDSVYPGIYLYEANDIIIRYNTIQDCVDSGMRIRSNSNNNTLIGNDITGSGVYDYYFSSSSINNTIQDPAAITDKIRCTCSSVVNIENTDNSAFTEDSLNSTYAYPTNFSMRVDSVSQTFDITQQNMTVNPSSDSIWVWNLVWGNSVSFNASNVSGAPHVWFNATQAIWANGNMSVYRNGTIYYTGTADANGLFAYNYSGGWSGHWFEFVPENIAPDKPTVVVPANGATGTSTNPTLRVHVTDPNSCDTLNVTFYTQGGTQISNTQTGIANGSTTSVVWSGRSYSTTYYWYAVADDGTTQTQSDTWHFTTQTDGGDGGGGGGSSHVILISGCTDWEGNAGSQVYIDFGCTGETAGATFTTNATNGSIGPSSGIYTWNTNTADGGVYTWRFNVENVYSISDYCDISITVYHYASPTNLAATTGNFWVNHTWDGNGFADSYNVSVNDVWLNGSTDQYYYHVRSPHAWSNISVAAYNDTTGLSSFISNDVRVPNNPITLTNYTTLMLATAGDNVTVDMNHEDLDGDTATYYCSRMDLFTDFNTADGTGQYTNAVNGTHEVIFGVTDGYGWSNQTITIEVGTVHPLELDEETPLILFVVLVVLLFGSLFYIYHAASYVAKIVTALISTWMSFMLSNMAVSGNVVLNYAELSSGDVFVYGTHSIQIAALSHFFMFTGVVSALFMLVFAVKLVTDTYLNMQEKRKADEEWDGVEEQ